MKLKTHVATSADMEVGYAYADHEAEAQDCTKGAWSGNSTNFNI